MHADFHLPCSDNATTRANRPLAGTSSEHQGTSDIQLMEVAQVYKDFNFLHAMMPHAGLGYFNKTIYGVAGSTATIVQCRHAHLIHIIIIMCGVYNLYIRMLFIRFVYMHSFVYDDKGDLPQNYVHNFMCLNLLFAKWESSIVHS